MCASEDGEEDVSKMVSEVKLMELAVGLDVVAKEKRGK